MGFISRFSALLILILISPIILIISFLLLLFQGRPIFFKQSRVGYKLQLFKIYKFRTMKENSGDLVTAYNDDRVTKFGKILRKNKIDELPQLFNIIRGEMRFIGPRPEVEKYFSKKDFQFLKKIKPGLSDYSSIVLRNETDILKKIGGKNPYNDLLPIKLKLADFYSNKKNFLLDLKLVIITIISIIAPSFCSKTLIIPELSNKIPEVKFFFQRYLL